MQLDTFDSTVLAHNHPFGACEPSQSDIRITEQLKKARGDIRVLNHVMAKDSVNYLFEQGSV